MIISPGNRISWSLMFASVGLFGRLDKKWLCLASLPFNSWIGLEHQRVLWLVIVVSLFGNRGVQISHSSNMSSCILGLSLNKFIVSSTIISMSRAIVIHFRRSIFMTLTAMTSLTEVAAVTFEK